MPEIIIYTSDDDCSNATAEIPAFTVGDATNDWTLIFKDENGTQFTPSGVTMRVGHINGLPNGTYNNAFTWVDRADNESVASITVTSGVPSVTFNVNPAGGVVGANGVYLLRGTQLDGAITEIEILDAGQSDSTTNWVNQNQGLSIDGGNLYISRYFSYTYRSVPDGSGTSYAVAYVFINSSGQAQSVTLLNGGTGFTSPPQVELNRSAAALAYSNVGSYDPVFLAKGNWPKYEFPFKRDDSGNDVLGATVLSPYSDGKTEGSIQYDHSLLVVRPQTVATASLSQNGSGSTGFWSGTMNPINNYVTERLALRRSTQLDIQIYGDSRMLFQGQIAILDKIA